MEVVALWSSLGIYLALWATAVVVETRRVTRRKGKKTMEQPYRCCPNQGCERYLVVGRYRYPACQQKDCGWSLVEPSLEDLGELVFPDEAIDVEATMAYADFINRFGVSVEMDVAVCLMQLEQRYNVRITATSNHTSSLPVVQRQSTPPPDYKSSGGISTFEQWNRTDFVMWMRGRGKFSEYFSAEELRTQEQER